MYPRDAHAEITSSSDTPRAEPSGERAGALHLFEAVREHPLQPLDTALNLRNAWWLADAALLAYSNEADARKAVGAAGITADIACFHGVHSTQAYVIAMPDAIVLAFRGTQVDDFWSSVLDFAVDARSCRRPTHTGTWCMPGFLPRSRKCGFRSRRI